MDCKCPVMNSGIPANQTNKQTKIFEDMDVLNSWPSFKQFSGIVSLSNVEKNKNPCKTDSMEKDVHRFLLVLLRFLLSGRWSEVGVESSSRNSKSWAQN